MNQDERLMGFLDVVDGEVERWRSKRIEDERNDQMKQNMAGTLRGNRG